MPEEKVLLLHEGTTGMVLKAFYQVYNALGYGFSEHVYENAMVIALRKLGLKVEQQKEITVYYEGEAVGLFKADLLVSNLVVVELKAAKALDDEHEAQLLNYLKATTYEVGQLLNFGPKPERVRRAYSNANKGSLSWLHP